MRVAIAGAGAVGRAIARELLGKEHEVLLIDKDAHKVQPDRIKGAEWLQGDACELANLENARLEECGTREAAGGAVGGEDAMRARAPRVHHALRDALVVEVHDLLAQVEVLQENRPSGARLERVVTVGDPHPVRRGEGVTGLGPRVPSLLRT